jgi:hypothetical protein
MYHNIQYVQTVWHRTFILLVPAIDIVKFGHPVRRMFNTSLMNIFPCLVIFGFTANNDRIYLESNALEE